jgi:hypothetical protein
MEENKLEAQPAVMQMTVSITRKATGLTETYHLTGNTTVEEMKAAGVPEAQPAPKEQQ